MSGGPRKNGGYRYRAVVGPEGEGARVADWLAARYRHSPLEVWEERVLSGEVSVAGRLADPSTILSAGQEVLWARPPWVEEAVPLHYEVMYEDPWLVAVAKPSGLPTLPAGGFLEHTLHHQVARRFPDAHALHRLGRGTSGLVLFGKTRGARAELSRAFRKRGIERTYLALVDGNPPWERRSIRAAIGPVPHPILGTIHAAAPDGREARTEVEVLRRQGEGTWVRARLGTGRPHQIRIHLAAAGHPLVGDPLYRVGGLPRPDVLPGAGGYRLHASELAFVHPKTGEGVRIEAPAPAGWGIG